MVQGHRNIAFIVGPPDQDDSARLAGYRDTLAKHKIEGDPQLIVASDFQESGGLLAVNQLLESGRRFTAIFAANDLLAYGARLALYRRKIRVPEDISIVGFNDLHSSMCTTPPLTTVRQPLFDVGRCLGPTMLKMMAHEELQVMCRRISWSCANIHWPWARMMISVPLALVADACTCEHVGRLVRRRLFECLKNSSDHDGNAHNFLY